MQGIVRNAYDVVAHIAQLNPSIETITVVTYREGPNWRDLHRPGEDAEATFLRNGISQDRGPRVLTEIPRSEASAEKLCNMAQSLGETGLLGVCSRVRLAGGKSAHIPMMDFICSISVTNRNLIVQLIDNVRHGQGCLLESGRSYHYYGFKLLNENEWRVFLGKCLLMSGFADDRYIGHQLVDGYCVLRLSSRKANTCLPAVVAELS
jgi:hypothetical protein